MRNKYIDFYLDNLNKIMAIHDAKESLLSAKFNALFATIKDIELDLNNINTCINIIKSDPSNNSDFRGKYIINTAVDLSLRPNHSENFDYMLRVYKVLKESFSDRTFLGLSSQIFCYFKDSIELDRITDSLRFALKHVETYNWYTYKLLDISMLSFICSNNDQLEKVFAEIELSHHYLKDNSAFEKDNLYSISQILSRSNESVENRCRKFILLNSILQKHDITLDNNLVSVMSFASIILEDFDKFAITYKDIDLKLNSMKAFSEPNLENPFRAMIAASLAIIDILHNCGQYEGKVNLIDLLCVILLTISTAETTYTPASIHPEIISSI